VSVGHFHCIPAAVCGKPATGVTWKNVQLLTFAADGRYGPYPLRSGVVPNEPTKWIARGIRPPAFPPNGAAQEML